MERMRRRLLCQPAAGRQAREMIRTVLPAKAGCDVELASLMVSELVSNAVRHGCPDRGYIEVEVTAERGRLTMRVVQPGRLFDPVWVRRRQPGKDRGWGIMLIERLAANWGIDDSAVWVEMPLIGS